MSKGLLIGLGLLFALLALTGAPGGSVALGLAAVIGVASLWGRVQRLEREARDLREQVDRLAGHPAGAMPQPSIEPAGVDGPGAPVPAVPPAATAPEAPTTVPKAPTWAPHASGEGIDDWAWSDSPLATAAAPAAAAPAAVSTTKLPVAEPGVVPPLEPDESSTDVVSSLGRSLLAWFTGGNAIVRAAVVILFVGVAFLMRYAAEHALLPLELRLAAVAAGGLAMVGVGWRLRERRRGYSLSLQGGGIAVIYLTLFAAFRLYGLLPGALAFGLLAALAALSALLAVLQNALPLAVLGFSGGFLAPVLTSTGQGSHVALFSYVLLLNLGIAWIASRQTWKLLNLVGFGFSFGLATIWGLQAWRPELLASTEPFLVAHVLLYLYITVQYSRQLVKLRDAAPHLPYVDGGLVFGMPLAAFGLQAGMVKGIPYALALSAAALAAVYLLLGRWLLRQGGQRTLLLTEATLALGVIFLALVTPLALDARWTGAAWAIQGAGLAWVAMRQQRIWALAIGLLLQVGGAIGFWSHDPRPAGLLLFANGYFVGALCLAWAALFTAWHLFRASVATDRDRLWWREADPRLLHPLLLGAGVLHALAGGWSELQAASWTGPDLPGRAVWLLLGWTLLAEGLQRRLGWPAFGIPGRLTWLAATAIAAAAAADPWPVSRGWHRLLDQGWGEIAAVAGIGWWLLRRLDHDAGLARRSSPIEHLALGWFGVLQGAVGLYLLVATQVTRHAAWTPTAVIVLPTLGCAWWAHRLANGAWPAATHPRAVRDGLLLPWLGLLMLWMLAVNLLADGSMRPLPYLPLLNPVDLGHALVALYGLRLLSGRQAPGRPSEAQPAPRPEPSVQPWSLLATLCGFVWLNGVLVRSLHHWAGTPMWLDGALRSGLVQTCLTILWTLTALGVMLVATRRVRPERARGVWMAGASLLGIVVLKLLLVDMAGIGTLERIVSFIVVGLLMLVIGYLSPLPPAAPADVGRPARGTTE